MKNFWSHFGGLAVVASLCGAGQFLMTPSAWAQTFVHPGGLHTKADLDRMKSRVAAGDHPWIDGWNQLIADPRARNTYTAAPRGNMGVSRQRAQDDASSAYLNAMRWYISGDTSDADCAVRNLNGWSATVNEVPHGTDQPGLGGIPIGTFALAAEVLRVYPGWPEADQDRFKNMLLSYFYPACNDFLTNHNGGGPSRYWANWDTANILAVMAIGVFCDDRAKFDQGVTYFKSGAGMGSIMHAVSFMHPGGLGQWQENGRDQAHALGGLGLLAEACQVAWNQKLDLFGFADNRLLAGAEYTAQYTLWKGVPYAYYNNSDNANQYYIAANYHGRLDNCQDFELLYNHYVVLKGLQAPNVKRFAEVERPERGNADILGYGTLTFTLDAAASPYPALPAPPTPLDLTATAGIGRVDLKWSPSGAYSTQGYNVLRATAADGPYSTVFSTTNNTTPRYTDSAVTSGTTYYYEVSAINQAGASGNSAPVNATPAGGGALPTDWTDGNIGTPADPGSATYAGAANRSFVLQGGGSGIETKSDSCHFTSQTVTGDFTITARLIGQSGGRKTGLMMRGSTDAGAAAVSMTLGDVGGRCARMGVRSNATGDMTFADGDQYTWIPVWFRLQRLGDKIIASQSSDGATWFTVGAPTVALPGTYLVGLMTCSGTNDGAPATANFDNVTLAPAPPLAPPPTGKLTAVRGSGGIGLTWKYKPANQVGFKVESSVDKVHFYEIADLEAGATNFTNTGVSPVTPCYYRVRAYNTGGYSPYSNVAGGRAPTRAAVRSVDSRPALR